MKVCNRCGIEKTLDEFYRDAKGKDGHKNKCKLCDLQWHKDNRAQDAVTERKRLYGLTPEAFEDLLAKQGGICAGCLTDNPGKRGWMVDHNHSCCPGRKSCGHCVRGLLCDRCNVALGRVDDNPSTLMRLAEYPKR